VVFALALGVDSLRRMMARTARDPIPSSARHDHRHQHGDLLHDHEHPTKLDQEHSHHPASPASAAKDLATDLSAGGGNGTSRLHLTVEGMTCAYCVRAVERAIGRVEGVTSVRVDLESRSVDINLEGPGGPERVREAIRHAGYHPQG
jgi:copper ion binding protein